MKKILEILKAGWNWVCSILNKALGWALSRSTEKWLVFSLGLIITAFSCITLHIEFSPVTAISIVIIHAFVRNWKNKTFLWKDYVAFLVGSLIIWVFALI